MAMTIDSSLLSGQQRNGKQERGRENKFKQKKLKKAEQFTALLLGDGTVLKRQSCNVDNKQEPYIVVGQTCDISFKKDKKVQMIRSQYHC